MAPGIEVSVTSVIPVIFFAFLYLFILKKYNLFQKHPNYNPNNNRNDIAILKLSRSVELNQYIQIACLPKEQSTTYPVPEQPAWIVGWGKYFSK